MQNDQDEKITYKITSCRALEPCFDLDNYDPCELGHDITEKDLDIFLKEEDKAKTKLEPNEELISSPELKSGYDGIREVLGTSQNETFHDKAVSNETVKGRGFDKSRDEEAEAGHKAKKRVCKKKIKNFFSTNRLKFSSDLPPPPLTPPEQFFPPAEETDSEGKIICPNRRKKCKKKTDVKSKAESTKKKDDDEGITGRTRKDTTGKTKDEGITNEEEGKDKTRMNNQGTKGQEKEDESLRDRESEEKSEAEGKGESDERESNLFEQEQGNKDEKIEDRATWGQDGVGKKKCKKPSERPPCRKILSEISLMLQPRRIPAHQRDLPPTSPKDIPEVKRQILMGCKNICKVECRKTKSNKIKRK